MALENVEYTVLYTVQCTVYKVSWNINIFNPPYSCTRKAPHLVPGPGPLLSGLLPAVSALQYLNLSGARVALLTAGSSPIHNLHPPKLCM